MVSKAVAPTRHDHVTIGAMTSPLLPPANATACAMEFADADDDEYSREACAAILMLEIDTDLAYRHIMMMIAQFRCAHDELQPTIDMINTVILPHVGRMKVVCRWWSFITPTFQ